MSKLIEEPSASLQLKLNAFMSEKAVMTVTSLSRTSLYRKRVAGEFPEPEEITEGRVGYRVRDIEAWLQNPKGWSSCRNSPSI